MGSERLEGVIGIRDNISSALQNIRNNTGSFTDNVKRAKAELERLEAVRLQQKALGLDTTELDNAIGDLDYISRYRVPSHDINLDSSDVEHANENMRETEDIVGRLKAALGTLAIGAAIKAAVGAGVEYNATMESYTTSFTTMLGSAKEADALMNDLRDKAAKTPFELTDLTSATQLLMNYGMTAEEATSRMMMLGDISQGNAEKMNRIATAYGQMSSAGKVSLEDINQMIEAGFNPLNEMSQTTGDSIASLRERISKGTITVDEITASMERATSEGGKYFQSMYAQSQTFNGVLSTLKDNLAQLGGQATEGIFDGLKSAMMGITAEMDRLSATGELKSAMQSIGSALGTVVNVGAGVIKVLWDMRGAVVAAGVGFGAYKAVMLAQKGWQSVAGIYKGVSLAIKAVQAARAADTAASGAQIIAKARDTVASTASAAASAAEAGAEGADTAATNANTVATAANAVATNGLTIATKLLAAAQAMTPWGWAAIAIGAVVGALALLSGGTSEAKERTKALATAIEDANNTMAQADTTFAKNLAEVEANADAARLEVDQLLVTQDEFYAGNVSGSVLNEEINNLTEKYPELRDAISEVNGQLTIQEDKVYDLIDAQLMQAQAEAYLENYKQLQADKTAFVEDNKEGIEGDKSELAELKKKYGMPEDAVASQDGKWLNDVGAFLGVVGSKDRSRIQELQKNVTEYDASIANFDKKIDSSGQTYRDFVAQGVKEKEEETADETTVPEYSKSMMDTMEKVRPDIDRLNTAGASIENGNVNWGLKQAGATDKEISEVGGDAKKAMELVNQKIEEAANSALVETATMAEDVLAKHGEELTIAERVALEDYVAQIRDGLDTSSKTAGESMGLAIGWLKTWKLPIDVKITTKDGKVSSVDAGGTQEVQNAAGTSYFAGGSTRINEQGDEVIDLPTGSRIYPAQESGRMMQEIKQGGNINVNISGITVREEADIDKIVSLLIQKLNRQRLIMG